MGWDNPIKIGLNGTMNKLNLEGFIRKDIRNIATEKDKNCLKCIMYKDEQRAGRSNVIKKV